MSQSNIFRPVGNFFRETNARVDLVEVSARFLFYGIMLSLVKILWKMGETSGFFGTPPDAWVSSVSDLGTAILVLYTVMGTLFLVEAMRRYTDQQNEPISPLILNTIGMGVMLVLVLRVDSVMETSPRTFITWADLFVQGLTRGGVYALIALGYTLVYGILFMINFAHGEVMMFGAFAGYLAMQYLVGGGIRTFEDGAVLVASLVLPFIIGVMFLPLEHLVQGLTNRSKTNFQTPTWLFTLFSAPVRFTVGFVIGYGAFVGLGSAAPEVFLLVITIFGILFVLFWAMATSMMLSVVLERIAYRPLRKAPRLAPLISAIGASVFLQQVALRIFGGNAKAYQSPRLLNQPKTFNINLGNLGELTISKVGLLIVVISILLMFLLYVIIQRTKVGKAMRAVAQDKSTAALMGINVDRVIMFTFMLGAALAGAGGALLGLRGDNIDYRFGFLPGIKAFTAAVVGGIGSIPGAMFGGFFLGIVEVLGPWLLGLGEAWKNAIAFSLLVLVLIFRPSGLFGAASEVKKV